ncbi:TfoX/Sxy family protein [Brachybacterium saurashtrense]|nr:TfoX/Sxy family protein [Brachybacterium saurashtrense]
MAMTPEQAELLAQVRALIADEGTVREVSMFGGRAVMVDERMLVSVQKDGTLLARVDAERHDELLTRPGAAQAQMGAGRSMGPGWIEVAAEALAEDEGLEAWIGVAREHHRAETGARR